MAVVVFHAFPWALPGGFVGVDVFFVISGYLITGIITSGLADGSFRFRDFYARRVRRILPALILVVLFCVVLGWFILLPSEYISVGKHALAAASFTSNFVLWSEAGYFDVASIEKPLLHLWSLAIEEQFYILWPVLLWGAHRIGVRPIWVIGLSTVASFLLCVWLTADHPHAAFYLPFARAWELGAGALLALTPSRWTSSKLTAGKANAAFAVGVALILAAFIVTPASSFPGWWPLLPVAGAGLILVAAQASWAGRCLLGNRAVVAVGLISYPLYLWHWPLLSYLHIVTNGVNGWGERAGVLALSVILAALTYRLLESPLRRREPSRRMVFSLVALLALLGLCGWALSLMAGVPDRLPQRARALAAYGYDPRSDIDFTKRCWISASDAPNGYGSTCLPTGGGTRPKIMIWGDSHAGRLRPGVEQVLGDRFQVYAATRDTCAASVAGDGNCGQGNKFILSEIRNAKPDVVVLFAHWQQHDVALLGRVTEQLKYDGIKRVVVIGPAPEWSAGLPALLLREWRHGRFKTPEAPARLRTGLVKDRALLDSEMRAYSWGEGVTYVSAYDILCNAEGCLTRAPGSAHLTSWDTGHLTTAGAAYVARRLGL